MAEYIEREALVHHFMTTRQYLTKDLVMDAAYEVSKFPSADVVPVVHGRWDGTANGYWDGELVYDIWNCSECGFDADGADEKPDWKYCPNCGARMDGGAADGV